MSEDKICTFCGMTGHRASHCPARDALNYLQQRCNVHAGCWLWKLSLDGHGLPIVSWGSTAEGKRASRSTRRLAYECAHGLLEKDMRVVTTCGEKTCISPKHLEAVSQSELRRRTAAAGHQAAPAARYANSLRQRAARSPLSVDDVRQLRHLRSQGHTIVDLAKRFCIGKSTVSRIARGESWLEAPPGASVFTWGLK